MPQRMQMQRQGLEEAPTHKGQASPEVGCTNPCKPNEITHSTTHPLLPPLNPQPQPTSRTKPLSLLTLPWHTNHPPLLSKKTEVPQINLPLCLNDMNNGWAGTHQLILSSAPGLPPRMPTNGKTNGCQEPPNAAPGSQPSLSPTASCIEQDTMGTIQM